MHNEPYVVPPPIDPHRFEVRHMAVVRDFGVPMFSREQLYRMGIETDTMLVFTASDSRVTVTGGVATVRGRMHTFGRTKWNELTRTIPMVPDSTYDIEAVQAYTQYLDHSQPATATPHEWYCWYADGVRTFDSAWVRKYPKAVAIIERILHQVSIDTSSHRDPCMYTVDYGALNFDLKDLLVPVQLVTPWVAGNSSVPDDQVRHIMMVWYLPTDRLLASLPNGYGATIEANYRSLMERLEQAP